MGVKSIDTGEHETLYVYLYENYYLHENNYSSSIRFNNINDLYYYLDTIYPNLRKENIYPQKMVLNDFIY